MLLAYYVKAIVISKVDVELVESQLGRSLKNMSCMSHLRDLFCRQDDLNYI